MLLDFILKTFQITPTSHAIVVEAFAKLVNDNEEDGLRVR